MKRLVFFSGALLLLSAAAGAAEKPRPSFDVRKLQALRPEGGKAGAPAWKAAAADYVRAAFGEGDDVRYSQTASGAPRSLRRAGGVLASASDSARGPVDAARAFTMQRRALFGLSAQDVEGLRTAGSESWGRGAALVELRQFVGSTPVWGGSIRIAVNGAGEVIQVLSGDLVSTASVDLRMTLSAADGARAALRSAGVDPEGFSGEPLTGSSAWTRFAHPAGRSPIAVQAAVFPLFDRTGVPAYRVFVDGMQGDTYEVLVDARSGQVLLRASLAAEYGTALVFTESPLAGPRTQVDFPQGWLPEGAQTTSGNNADAHLDRNQDGQPDPGDLPNIVGGRAFSPSGDFTFDHGDESNGRDPFDHAAAAVTNLFYYVNFSHDYFYGLGFDETAGNFQQDNFGRGGQQGDPVMAASQAGSDGRLLPRPDGVSPIMQIGVARSPFVAGRGRDISYAADVAIHEYAHGVTTRRVGGVHNVECLDQQMSGSLGEGWSDYFSISVTGDPLIGGYLNPPGNGRPGGIRRGTYEGYPLTFADVGNEGLQIHRDGEIWAATLWDARQALGAEVMDQLVYSGLSFAPCHPAMPDAKEGILTADEMLNGGANTAVLLEVFARHGLGHSSSGEDGLLELDSIVWNAAFDLPPAPGQNRNPTVSSAAPLADYRAPFSYQIRAVDPDGDPLSYTLVDGPAGMSVDGNGMVSWRVDRFTAARAQVEITDGRGGRTLHGFTVPVIAELQPGVGIPISAGFDQRGLAFVNIPAGREVLQFRLRGESQNPFDDADFVVFPPVGDPASSALPGLNETLTFPQPGGGPWLVIVDSLFGYEDAELSAVFPPVPTLQPGAFSTGLADVRSGERFFRFTVPEGIDQVIVTSGEGAGDADLSLAMGRIPTCPFSFFVLNTCDFDEISEQFGTTERIVLANGAAPLTAEGGRAFAVAPGEYFLNVAANDDYAGVSLAVLFDTGDPLPTPTQGGLVTAANFEPYLSPGGIASLFGAGLAAESVSAAETPLPTELGGVRVRIAGVDAPLYFVSPGQINFQMPYEAPLDGSVSVIRDGRQGPFEELFLFENAPEVFLYVAASGAAAPVVVHALDNSLVTPDNPARPGEVLTAFLTGLTRVSNAPASGSPAPASPLAVAEGEVLMYVDDKPAQVLFAGLTPGFVGLAQINFVVPEDAPAGMVVAYPATEDYDGEDVELAIAP